VRSKLPFLLAVGLASGAIEGTAWAENDAHSEPRQVLLVVAADPSEARKLGQVTTELLGRLSVKVQVNRVERIDFGEIARPAPRVPPYLARLFVDLRDGTGAVLWFVDSIHDRILVRKLGREPGSPELLREELGHILETSTEGLLSGAEIGLPRAEVMPTLTEPEAKSLPAGSARTNTPRSWQLAVLYEIEGFSSPAFVTQGPEASIFFRILQAPTLGLWTTFQYRLPIHVEGSPVGARIEGGAARALLTLDVPIHAGIKVRFGLGCGTDVVALAPESSQTNGVTLSDSRLLAFGVARAAVGIEVRVSRWVSFWSRVAADIDPSGEQYVFERQGGDEVVLEPWAVRPALAIGVGFP
jgi:hypothetical protein